MPEHQSVACAKKGWVRASNDHHLQPRLLSVSNDNKPTLTFGNAITTGDVQGSGRRNANTGASVVDTSKNATAHTVIFYR